jgi:hypothetical protein
MSRTVAQKKNGEGALLERANLGRLRLQHLEAEAPNAIMGWTMFQPRREQWTRQRYQRAPTERLRTRPQLENRAGWSPEQIAGRMELEGTEYTLRRSPSTAMPTARPAGALAFPATPASTDIPTPTSPTSSGTCLFTPLARASVCGYNHHNELAIGTHMAGLARRGRLFNAPHLQSPSQALRCICRIFYTK